MILVVLNNYHIPLLCILTATHIGCGSCLSMRRSSRKTQTRTSNLPLISKNPFAESVLLHFIYLFHELSRTCLFIF